MDRSEELSVKSEIQLEVSAYLSIVDRLHNEISMLEDALSAVLHPYPTGKLVSETMPARGSTLGSTLFESNENLNNGVNRLSTLRGALAI